MDEEEPRLGSSNGRDSGQRHPDHGPAELPSTFNKPVTLADGLFVCEGGERELHSAAADIQT